MPNKLQLAQSRTPQFYASYDQNSVMFALLNALAQVDTDRDTFITRIYGMIGIDSTYDEDLESRWGGLLATRKSTSETYNQYRIRLKLMFSSLVGGTTSAIRHSVASCMGINLSDQGAIDAVVKVYDAWEHPTWKHDYAEEDGYGSIVVEVNVGAITYESMEAKIQEIEATVAGIKAAGINPYMIYKVFEPDTYYKLNMTSYISLDQFTYDDLSKED